MGKDPIHIFNHTLSIKNTTEFIQQLKVITGHEVFIGRMSVCKTVSESFPPPDFTGWYTLLEDDETLGNMFSKNGHLFFSSLGLDEYIEIYVYQYCICFSGEQFYMGRWFEIQSMADAIRLHGSLVPKYYESTEMKNVSNYLLNRKNLFDYSRQFGSTIMVTLCEDIHQKAIANLVVNNWSIESFIEWGKKELIYVNFQDLPQFDFPTQLPDYYNVFIYDDFRDLA